jgi:hypothetical protein
MNKTEELLNRACEMIHVFEETCKKFGFLNAEGQKVLDDFFKEVQKLGESKDKQSAIMTNEEFFTIIRKKNNLEGCDVHLQALWREKKYNRIFEITGLKFEKD